MKKRIQIYDSMLRDGSQAVGISFSPQSKIQYALRLDELGVDFIEGGFAGSNEKDMRFFSDIRKEHLKTSRIVAFGSTRRAGAVVSDDPFVKALLRAETEFCAIYGKTSRLQIEEVLRTTEDENARMIADTIAFLRAHDRRVVFDAEHFFDGYRVSPEFSMRALQVAVDAGAETISLCDTNGGSLPHDVYDVTAKVCAHFPNIDISIHAHNDSGLGVANSLEAVRAGAVQVQGCLNGYGERSGNANLTTIIPTLELKMGRPCIGKGRLVELRAISLYLDDIVNQRPDIRAPYVGDASFSHKAGAHVSGVQKNSASFEHVPPELVGNERRIMLSELSGASNVLYRVKQMDENYANISQEAVRQILDRLKSREGEGYAFESADGSFQILMQKALKEHKSFFQLESFRVVVEKRGPSEPCMSEATIKVNVSGQTELTAGEGVGPVEALDRALRKALVRFYPEISDVALTDYRVRILDPNEATAAITRVIMESSDGKRQWGTVGVSQNIIEASWQALVDSMEYKLFSDEKAESLPLGETVKNP